MTPLESAKKHANMMNAAYDMYEALKDCYAVLNRAMEHQIDARDTEQISLTEECIYTAIAALTKAEGNQ